jgi:PAS domain S-box-containing protein
MIERRLVILIVEDEAAHVEAIRRAFRDSGIAAEIRVSSTLQEYRQSIASSKPDLALMNLNLSDGRAMDVLVTPPENGPIPILIMTSRGNDKIAVETMRSGALDFLVKSPETFLAMPRIVERALREWKLLQEHRKSERTLKEREEWFRALFENATDGIFYLSSAGKIIMVNESFARMHGYTVEEMMKIDLKDLDTPESAKLIPERMRRVLSGENLVFEVEQYCKDGSIISLEVTTSHITAGGEQYILAFHRDISERKRIESSLIMSEARYRHLFENMLEGYAYCKMLYVDGVPQDFIYFHVNAAFETLTGLKNVVGKKVSEVIPGIQESDKGLFELYGRVAMTGKPERFETYVQALQMWFSISVYSPEKEFFVAVFDVITQAGRSGAYRTGPTRPVPCHSRSGARRSREPERDVEHVLSVPGGHLWSRIRPDLDTERKGAGA